MSLEARLDEIERRLEEIEAEWSRPEVATDPERSKALGREQAQLAPVVDSHRRLRGVREQLACRPPRARHRERPGAARAGPRDHRRARGRGGGPGGAAARPAAAARPQRRARRHHRDPRRHRRRGGAIFAADLFRMYARYAERQRWKAETLSTQRVGHPWPARGHLRDQRRRRLQPPQVRGRRAPRAARAGDRGQRPHPHLDGHRGRAAQGRRGRRPDRRGQGPAHRRQALVGSRRAVGQHDRLRGAHHAPAQRPGGGDPGREEPAQEQGQGHGRAALAAARDGAAQGAGRGGRGAPLHGRQRRALREDPHLQLPAGPHHRPPHRPGRPRPPGVLDGDLDRLIDALITTDQAERLASLESRPARG